MTPRITLAVCSIVSFAVGGTVVASHYHLFPQGQVLRKDNCQVAIQTLGQVKLYDLEDHLIGEYNRNAAMSAPGAAYSVVADVYIDGKQKITISGSGRQPVKDTDGRVLGYAELIPFATAAATTPGTYPLGGTRQYARPAPSGQTAVASAPPAQTRSVSQLHESIVTNGWNTAFGLLSDGNGNYGWQFVGVGKVRLHLTSGKIISRATALPLTKKRREQLKRELTPADFEFRVGSGNRDNPGVPVFNITINNNRHEFGGYTTENFLLPDGTTLVVDIMPLDQE